MVVRVPLLGMVVAVALLLAENLGANAYIAAKQRAADRQAEVDAAQAREDAQIEIEIERLRLAAEKLRNEH